MLAAAQRDRARRPNRDALTRSDDYQNEGTLVASASVDRVDGPAEGFFGILRQLSFDDAAEDRSITDEQNHRVGSVLGWQRLAQRCVRQPSFIERGYLDVQQLAQQIGDELW